MARTFLTALLSTAMAPSLVCADVEKYVCTFELYHSLDNFEMSKADDFVLAYTFDTVTRNAFLEGNNGLSEVTLIDGNSGATFLEVLPSGVVQTTTVALGGAAVHSRHTIIVGELSPSQYYGICE